MFAGEKLRDCRSRNIWAWLFLMECERRMFLEGRPDIHRAMILCGSDVVDDGVGLFLMFALGCWWGVWRRNHGCRRTMIARSWHGWLILFIVLRERSLLFAFIFEWMLEEPIALVGDTWWLSQYLSMNRAGKISAVLHYGPEKEFIFTHSQNQWFQPGGKWLLRNNIYC